jgi:iron-sulfur cluster repair protein YtfE (RIC family)
MDSVESFHTAHEELRDWTPRLTSTARNLPSMTHGEREGAISGLLADLAAVDVHMRLDEHALFPEVASRLRDPLATASMAYDHLAIRDWISRLCAASLSDVNELQELLYGLVALIRVHIWKEDALYLAMLENPSWPDSEITSLQ